MSVAWTSCTDPTLGTALEDMWVSPRDDVGNRQIRPWIAFDRGNAWESINLPRPPVDYGLLMNVANSSTRRERTAFRIVCDDCGSLSIKVADPVNAPSTTPVQCGRCGALRGTLADLRHLALRNGDIFEF
jgi:hypothetical protein